MSDLQVFQRTSSKLGTVSAVNLPTADPLAKAQEFTSNQIKQTKMKITNVKKWALAVIMAGLASYASAIPLTIGDAYYLGRITDGIPSSEANEAAFINYLVTLAPGAASTQIPAGTGELYNRIGSTLVATFPAAVVTGTVREGTGGVTTIDATGFAYVLAKYAASDAGSLVWYVADVAGGVGAVEVPSTFNNRGVSHISLYKATGTPQPPVSDGGSTIALLGAVMCGVGFLRRKLGKA